MENKDIAKAVIEAIGGRDNVSSVAHCATRLRIMVKDEAKIAKDRVENLEKVQGAFFNSGQYQIIFGTGTVNKIYDEVVALGLPTSSTGEQKAEAAKKTGGGIVDTIKNGNEGLDMEVIKETNYVPYYVGGGIGVLVIAAGAFFALKKRKNN